jgi:hypothetical protein
MGGGGGAGEGNNGFATNGQNGGGIILIKATEIETTSCGSGLTISASGGSTPGTGGNDGGGGGGAGGSIVFEVESWNISATCPLTISANGGNGGNVNTGAVHGGGGGGGQGVVVFSTTAPSTNVTVEANNGTGGCNNSACDSSAEPGTGTDGSGILEILTGPLPIELIRFNGAYRDNVVELAWSTKSEINNDYFTIDRSTDGLHWVSLNKQNGAGNSNETINYQSYDIHPLKGISYYRLSQTDFDGSSDILGTVTINNDEAQTLVYPNPTNDVVHIVSDQLNNVELTIIDPLGRMFNQNFTKVAENQLEFSMADYIPGVYTISLKKNNHVELFRIVVLE